MPIACRYPPRVQTATIWFPGSRSTLFTGDLDLENDRRERDGQMLGEHRMQTGELLLVVGIHGGLPGQLVEFRVAQLPVHREHGTGGARSSPAGCSP